MSKNYILVPIIIFLMSCGQTNDPTERITEKNISKFYDLERGIQQAKTENKPILLYFTGYACVNCRRIEENLLFANQDIAATIQDDYINVWLYTDDKTIGKKWQTYQEENFLYYTTPYFIILDSNGKAISDGLNSEQAHLHLEKVLSMHK